MKKIITIVMLAGCVQMAAAQGKSGAYMGGDNYGGYATGTGVSSTTGSDYSRDGIALSYNRLQLLYAHEEIDDSVFDSADGLIARLQFSPVNHLYFNIFGSYAYAEGDGLFSNIESDDINVGLGIGGYIPLNDSVHFTLGIDGSYEKAEAEDTVFGGSVDADGWVVSPNIGLRIAVMPMVELFGKLAYNYGEFDVDNIDDEFDVDGISGELGAIFGVTDNFGIVVSAAGAEDVVSGRIGIQLSW